MSNKVDELTGKISVGNLMDGFAEYFNTLGVISRNFTSFPNTLSDNVELEFRKAFKFVSYAIVLSFFIVLPMYVAHQESITKVLFYIRLLAGYAIYCVILHFALKLFGAKDITIKQTATIYSYIGGVGLPAYLLFALPILIQMGPTGLFGNYEESLALTSGLKFSLGLSIYFAVGMWVLSIFAIVMALSWLSKSHKIGKWFVFFAYIVTSIIGTPITLFVVNPAFNALYKLINYWLGLVF
jgi:hypothetical protein